jgi:hypothetical protein
MIYAPPYMNNEFTLNDFKTRLQEAKNAITSLESVTGKLPQLKRFLTDQHIKYNFLCKPKNHYREFFMAMNGNPMK